MLAVTNLTVITRTFDVGVEFCGKGGPRASAYTFVSFENQLLFIILLILHWFRFRHWSFLEASEFGALYFRSVTRFGGTRVREKKHHYTQGVFFKYFVSSTAGVPVQYCEQPTNGITYFRAISSISDIPEDLRVYLPLFCYILTRYELGKLD